ncbi:hypothetical protein Bca4012_041663 [Brassica carinata]|uniref:Uncharacterized protein n=1 Tax=Brassica oleracea TaxID=3712 RepID=A0A3P6DN49_BRAOL|nr:unnamed protein product [Brassica oleracea]
MFGMGMPIMRSVNGVLCVSSMTMSISMENLWADRTEMHLGLTSSKEAGDTNTSKEAGDTNRRLPSVETEEQRLTQSDIPLHRKRVPCHRQRAKEYHLSKETQEGI